MYRFKILGVTLDEKLIWEEHVNYAVSKISKIRGIVLKVRKVYLNMFFALCYLFWLYGYIV